MYVFLYVRSLIKKSFQNGKCNISWKVRCVIDIFKIGNFVEYAWKMCAARMMIRLKYWNFENLMEFGKTDGVYSILL